MLQKNSIKITLLSKDYDIPTIVWRPQEDNSTPITIFESFLVCISVFVTCEGYGNTN